MWCVVVAVVVVAVGVDVIDVINDWARPPARAMATARARARTATLANGG